MRIPKGKLPLKLRRNLCPLAKTSTWHSIGLVSLLCPQHCADCKRKLVFIYSPSLFPKDLKDGWKLLKRKPHLFIVILIYNIAIAVVTNTEEGHAGKQKGTLGIIVDWGGTEATTLSAKTLQGWKYMPVPAWGQSGNWWGNTPRCQTWRRNQGSSGKQETVTRWLWRVHWYCGFCGLKNRRHGPEATQGDKASTGLLGESQKPRCLPLPQKRDGRTTHWRRDKHVGHVHSLCQAWETVTSRHRKPGLSLCWVLRLQIYSFLGLEPETKKLT